MPLKRVVQAAPLASQGQPVKLRRRAIIINSTPRRAKVYLGRRYLGKTPLKLRQRLRGGKQYKLSLRRRGYRPAEYMLRGEQGWRKKGEAKVLKISVPLKKVGNTTMDF